MQISQNIMQKFLMLMQTYEDEAGRQKLNQGAEERADIREQNRRANSNLIAKAAGGGIDISGSVTDLLDQNITTGELNAYTVLNNAERDAYGNKVRAQNFRTEAVNTRFQSEVALNNANYQAKTVKNNALWQAAGTLVNGATKAASMGASGGVSAGGSKMAVGDSYTRNLGNGGSVSVKRLPNNTSF
jgi:hypothetical protein